MNNASVIRCNSGEFLYIAPDVTVVEQRAFAGDERVRFVFMAGDVTMICRSAFEGCTHLEKVFIPKTVARIENDAFAECHKLTTINIPKSCEVAEGAFARCYYLHLNSDGVTRE